MITLILLFLPFIAGLLLLILKNETAKKIALGLSLVEFCIALYACCSFDKTATGSQFDFNVAWIQSLHTHFHVGMDGISLLLVLLTTFLLPFIILIVGKRDYAKASVLYSLIFFMEFALIGVFTSVDAFLFYIFWEIAIIPVYFMSLIWGGADKIKISIKFFIYTLIGSFCMLVSLIYLYYQTPAPHEFSITAFYQLNLSPETQGILFWAFFIAFAIKVPVFPFHSWLGDTYTDAPTPGTMLMSGLMSKMGLYGILRLLLPIAPLGVAKWGYVAMALSVISVVYASLLTLYQKDYKRLAAYSSIAHVGLIAAGLFCVNTYGLQGAMIQMLAHGICAIGLFYGLDVLMNKAGTRQINELGGIKLAAPKFATVFLIVTLASIALPLTGSFVGEFLLLLGIAQTSYVLAAIGGLTTILGAVYMLKSFQKAFLGEQTATSMKVTDLSFREVLVFIPIIIAIFFIGVYPKPLLQLTETSVNHLLSIMAVK